MKSKIINVFMFAAGAAIGSAVSWKILKTKYDNIIQEEIDSVKEAFSNRYDNSTNSDDQPEENEDEDEEGSSKPSQKINRFELEDVLEDEEPYFTEEEKSEYTKIASTYTSEKGGVEEMNSIAKPPYVISPLDFGELDDYHQVELTYYLDGILEDEDYHIVTDADELIGPDALTTFGEYEDDSVFVRNERLCTDFQILRDYRTYDEARCAGPTQVDD